MEFKDLEGPFNSIMDLKKGSNIFKDLAKSDQKNTKWILKESNIINCSKLIFTKGNKVVSRDFIKLMEHSMRGTIRSKEILGIHYFDKDKMEILNLTDSEDENQVWKAKVKVFDLESNESYIKESTFFPKSWSLTKLFHECDYAYLNKVKIEEKKYIYESTTPSGVPVEIVIKNEIVKSIYPIYNK
ncbi:MAG: EndoU domain-containing protein [Bacteroidetes bacterium]|nr:EndoU domain-containing protein [Bacteroidota bacterium]